MNDFRGAFTSLRPSVVGLGYWRDPAFEILGTGFIIAEAGLIATNAHVVEALLNRDRTALEKGAAVFLFTRGAAQPPFKAVVGLVITRIAEAAVIPDSTPPDPDQPPPLFRGLQPWQAIPVDPSDLGVVRIDPGSLPPECLPLPPVRISSSASVREGTPVGILGFPQGLRHSGFYASGSEVQLSPLLQVGVISALLPMPESSDPDQFVLDILVNPGCSGSPLFLEDGSVVGAVFATRVAFQVLGTLTATGAFEPGTDGRGVLTPSGLGLAVPSDRFPRDWRTP